MLPWIVGALLAVAAAVYLLLHRAIRRAAHAIHAQGAAIYSGSHEYVRVSIDDFAHLDASFYERTAAALEAEGFSRVADIADMTITRAGGILMPMMARVLVGDGGRVTAALYHARVTGSAAQGEGNHHVVDLETAFDDGTYVNTSNAPSAGKLESPPTIHDDFVPGTEPLALLQRHRMRVSDYLRTRPGVDVRTVATLEDVIAMQQRQDDIKAAFRAARPAVYSDAELQRLAPDGPGSAAIARGVGRQLARLHDAR